MPGGFLWRTGASWDDLLTLLKRIDEVLATGESLHYQLKDLDQKMQERYPALELYLTYVNWCLNEGTDVHDQFSFLEMIEETGLSYTQGKKGCWFEGVSVLPPYRIE